MRHPLRIVGLSTALIGLACSGLEDASEEPIFDEPAYDEPAVAEPTEEEVSAFNISTGDCFQDVDGTTVTELTVVPCTQSHDNEAYHTFDLRMPNYNDEKIEEKSEKVCVVEFEKYVGKDYDSSKYHAAWMTPTPGSWEAGDREVICILYEDGAKLTNSARNTKL